MRESRNTKEVKTNVFLPGWAVDLLIFPKVETWQRSESTAAHPLFGKARMQEFPQRTLQMVARLQLF